MTVAIGSEGAVTLPSNFSALLNTWSASISRATSVITGFGDTGARRLASKVADITGSAAGTPNYDDSDLSAWDGITTVQDPANMTLTWVSAPECSIQFKALVNSVAVSTAVNGDATVAFNFEAAVAQGDTVTFTWDEE